MFLEARRDASEVFDPVEEAFDVVTFLVKGPGKAMANPAIDLVGNVRCRALGFDKIQKRLAVAHRPGYLLRHGVPPSLVGGNHHWFHIPQRRCTPPNFPEILLPHL